VANLIPSREIRAAGAAPQAAALRSAYLDLLKLALCDLVGAGTRTVTWTADRRLFSRQLTGDQINWRAGGRDWPENGLTMVGLSRLDDLQGCVESIVREGVEGDLIEAGAWRGGASILMRATLDTLGADDRTVWVADSFQGFPEPEAEGPEDDRDLELRLNDYGYLAAPLEEVREHFARFGCEQGVKFVPGFFEETMPALRGGRWSLIRLDGDTYKATRLSLHALYPGLSVGGYLVIDDYYHAYLPQARRAVDEFRREHGISERLERIDTSGARWRRESGGPRLAPPEPSHETSPRVAPKRTETPIPTDRELELRDRVARLEERLRAAESELELLRSSPFAGPSAWARRKAGRGA
jgi:Macrocin-O-methyltransferase (TylF)